MENATYTKDKIIKSKKYKRYRWILAAVLDDNGIYTLDQADNAIEAYRQKRVY